MPAAKKYTLHGYINYLPIEDGFVTPVFINDDSYFIQVTKDNDVIVCFEELRSAYSEIVCQINISNISKEEGDKCLYSFKNSTEILCKERYEMVVFFIDNLQTVENKNTGDSIIAFIKDYTKTNWNFGVSEYFSKRRKIQNIFHKASINYSGSFSSKIALPSLEGKFYDGISHWNKANDHHHFANFTPCEYNYDVLLKCYTDANLGPEMNMRPFVIHGSSGTGKTHLVNAFANHISKFDLRCALISPHFYLDTESNLVEKIEEVNKLTTNIRILIFDDVHLFENDPQKSIIFNSFKMLQEMGIKLILCYNSDVKKRDNLIEGFDDVYFSKPNKSGKINIINSKLDRFNIHFDESIINTIAENTPDNISELEKSIALIHLHSQRSNRMKLWSNTCQEILENYFDGKKKRKNEIILDAINNSVRSFLKVEEGYIGMISNNPNILKAKQITEFMWCLYFDSEISDEMVTNSAFQDLQSLFYSNEEFKSSVVEVFKNVNNKLEHI